MDIVPGAQTERRGDAGSVRASLGSKNLTGRFGEFAENFDSGCRASRGRIHAGQGGGVTAMSSRLYETMRGKGREPLTVLKVFFTLCDEFRDVLGAEIIRGCNIDDEHIHPALLRLAAEAMQSGGSIFVQ